MNKKEQAIALRSEGCSYKEIAKKVSVSMSSLSLWLKDVPLTHNQKTSLEKRGKTGGGAATKLKWQAERELVRSSYSPPFHDPSFTLGLALYWGEGTKWNESTVALANTDPKVLRVFCKWMNDYFPAEFEKLTVNVHHHNGEEGDLSSLQFWSEILSIPMANFQKSTLIKPRQISGEGKVRGSNRGTGHGIATVCVQGEGVWKIRQKIQHSIDLLD